MIANVLIYLALCAMGALAIWLFDHEDGGL